MANGGDYQSQLNDFNELVRDGKTYRELPHGMTDVVLNYVYDLNIILSSQGEVEQLLSSNMDLFLQNL